MAMCPFHDPALPALVAALDATRAAGPLAEIVRPFVPLQAHLRLRRPQVLAYKPQRRCVIAYDFDILVDDRPAMLSVVGKIRARKRADRGYQQLRALWNAGFSGSADDGVSVPEPIGVVAPFDMWLQRRIVGPTFTELLAPNATTRTARVADAVHKLQTIGVAARARHTIADELDILDRCLGNVATAVPWLAKRLACLAEDCGRIASMLPEPAWRPAHRDFYSDQVIVDGRGRLFILDLDLYCEADPGLDIGNFAGHVAEYSLRWYGTSAALAPLERALVTRFAALAGDAAAVAARAYAALTLARHVYLSTRFEDRRHTTIALLQLAESRVREFASEGGHA